MAHIIRRKAATIPAGTPKAAPATVDISIDPLEVVELHIWVPFGNRGNLGFKIANAGIQVYPYGNDDFVQMEGQWEAWPLEEAITSGSWQVIGYNTGSFNHTIQVVMLCRLPADPAALAALQPVSNAELSSPAPAVSGDLLGSIPPGPSL